MSASTGEVPGRIFMTYRREDTAYPAGWLFDRLAGHFGRDQVFKDIDSIELGDDFVEVITAAVGSCDALLALIGDRWLSSTGRDGQRRLDDPDDFVRLEIEAALARNVRVIPILVEGAQMPRAEELPASLAKLARRQALELSPARFDADTRRLLRVLDRTIAQAKERARQNAEAAAERRRRVGQLQQRIRDRAAARDWDAVVAAGDQLAGLDPAAADPDGLASMAREQIARRQAAGPPAVGAQQPAGDLQARRGEWPQANAGSQGLTPAGQAVAEPDAGVAPFPGVADHGAASEAGDGNPALVADVPGPDPGKETTSALGLRGADRALARPNAPGDPRSHIAAPQPDSSRPAASGTAAAPPDPLAPSTIDPAPIGEPWWAAAPAVAEATSRPAREPATTGVPGRPPEEPGRPTADAEGPASAADGRTAGSARAARSRFNIYRAQLARHMRRRIVIVPLVALLVVVIGGGFIAWQWTQSQYFVGADSKGEVTIYRGVNQRIAGISLSSPYQASGIRLAQVPTPYRQTLEATDATSSLSSARAIVANVRNAVDTCKQAYLDRQAWVARDNLYRAYKAAAALAARQHKKPPAAVANPGAGPATAGPLCPPSTVFGIAATDLVPAAAGSS
jgi:TIR domain